MPSHPARTVAPRAYRHTPRVPSLTPLFAVAVSVAASLWALYLVVPWHRLPYLSKYRGGISTTDGISYEQVGKLKGYSMEQFECPALRATPTADDLDQAVKLIAPDLAAHAWVKLPKDAAATPAAAAPPTQDASV